MILRRLAPTLHIPWALPFQLDDPPIVPTTFGKMYGNVLSVKNQTET